MPNEQELEQRIRERAYQIWIEDGQPEGKETAHWERAKAEIEKALGIGPSPGP